MQVEPDVVLELEISSPTVAEHDEVNVEPSDPTNHKAGTDEAPTENSDPSLTGSAEIETVKESLTSSSESDLWQPRSSPEMAALRALWRKKTHKQHCATTRASVLIAEHSRRMSRPRLGPAAVNEIDASSTSVSKRDRKGRQASMHAFLSPSGVSVSDASLASLDAPVCINVKPATEAPVLLSDWMECFHLDIVDVPADGHCLYGPFFAATAGTCDKGSISYEGETFEQVKTCRERILYVARDQLTVEAELGDRYQANQRDLVRELCPEEDWSGEVPHSTIVERLLRYYSDIELVGLETPVERHMWARAGELTSAAILLREPLYVLDVREDQTILAQQYSYKTVRDEGIALVETRLQRPVPMEEFTTLVNTCVQARVLLPILLLRHQAGGSHFQALRYSDLRYERFVNSETTTTKPCMRERLDGVHRFLNLAPVVSEPNYIFPTPEPVAATKPDADVTLPSLPVIPEIPSTNVGAVNKQHVEKNATIRARALRTDARLYNRILALGGDIDQGSVADRKKHRAYVEANKAVVMTWRAAANRQGITSVPAAIQGFDTVRCEDELMFSSCLSLFYLLPYPAIAAQQIGHQVLCKWGRHLALRAQLRSLQRVAEDDTAPAAARDMANEWYSAVVATTEVAAQIVLINEIARWKRLRRVSPTLSMGNKPAKLPVVEWELCNVLPYIFWNWRPVELDCVEPEQHWVSIGATKQLFIDNDYAELVISRILSSNNWQDTRMAVLNSPAESASASQLGSASTSPTGSDAPCRS